MVTLARMRLSRVCSCELHVRVHLCYVERRMQEGIKRLTTLFKRSREPSKSFPTPTRSPSTTSLAVIPNRASDLVVLRLLELRLSLDSLRSAVLELEDPCSRKR